MENRVRQLSIGADEMDRRQSVARRMNRNESNRLRQQYDQFRDNHEVIADDIDQEMKKIQNELHGIREITGYNAYARSSGDESANRNNSSSTKRKRRTLIQRKAIDTKSRRRLTREDSLVDNKVRFEEHSSLRSGNKLSRNMDSQHANEVRSQNVRRVTRTSNKEEKLPQLAGNTTSDTRSLLEFDVDEARTQVRKRILGENDFTVVTTQENEDSATPVNDVESYMYVPPDGRKRTVYLIPPLENLLKEARKARYLRMPKHLLDAGEDDPEKELSIDEIFSKRV